MAVFMRRNNGYTRAEWVSDAVVHGLGLVATLVAVPVLVTLTLVLRDDPRAAVAAAVYGGALILMIACSAVYNLLGHLRWGHILQRLDHSAIYLKIAGTYTPFLTVSGGQAGWLLTGIWGAALAGVALKMASPQRWRWIGLVLYLALGWAGLFAGADFLGQLSPAVLALILTGGALYTLGVLFYLAEGLPFHYTIWHVLVLVASFVFYAAVTVHVMTV